MGGNDETKVAAHTTLLRSKVEHYHNFKTLIQSNVDREPLTNLKIFSYLDSDLHG